MVGPPDRAGKQRRRLRSGIAVLALAAASGACTPAAGRRPAAAAPPAPARTAAPTVASLPCPDRLPAPPAPADPRIAEGETAYDAGRYGPALALFEAVEREGGADGVVLYRMAFCYGAARNDPVRAQETYDRARAALEEKIAAGGASLDDRFYLVNALLNLGRDEEARAAALAAVAGIEDCSIPVGPDGTSAFRVAKLHADAGLVEGQAPWFRRALEAFEREGNAPAAYVQRSIDGLSAAGDWSAAARQLEKLAAQRPGDPVTLVKLTAARLMTGEFDAAQESLDRARALGGAYVLSEFSYLKGLIAKARRMADSGHPFAAGEPDGRPAAGLDEEELRSRIREAGQEVGRLLAEEPAETDTIVDERGPQRIRVRLPAPGLLARIDAAQARLLALSLEVIRRGQSLQETAFTLGVSPYVVHDLRDEWVRLQRRRDSEAEDEKEGPAPAGPGL